MKQAKAMPTLRKYEIPYQMAIGERYERPKTLNRTLNRTTRRSNIAYYLTALLLFSLPLAAEVFRKFFVYSNGVLVISDALAALIAAVLFVLRPARRSMYTAGGVSVLSAWGVVTALLGHQNGMLLLVGLRSIIVPASYMVGAIQLARRLGASRIVGVLYRVATFCYL